MTTQNELELERELALIHSLDEARDASRGTGDLLRRCAALLQEVVEAEASVMWLAPGAGVSGPENGRGDRPSPPAWLEEPDAQEALARGDVLTRQDADGRHWLVTPLRRHEALLGAIALMDTEAPFDEVERRLIAHTVAQADSALAHALEHEELRRRRRELEVIHRIDQIRDSQASFQEKLHTVCGLLGGLLGAEVGFVMLFDLTGKELELHAVTHSGRFGDPERLKQDPAFREMLNRLARATLDAAHLQRLEGLPHPWLGYTGVPLVLREEVIGVVGAIRGPDHPPFDAEDKAILGEVAGQIDTAIFENRERLRVRQAFARYVHPLVVDQLIERGEDVLAPRRETLTVLFSDIRGFTAMSETREPQFVVALLDEHLDAMAEVVMAHGGTVDKFVGDEVMAIFGAPLTMEDHAVRAVRTAQAMVQRQHALAAVWKQRGWPEMEIGIGINTGPMMVGNIGSERMSNYTVIGSAVNLGARLCGAAGGSQILLSESTAALVRDHLPLAPLPPVALKGIAEPVPVWGVKGDV